MPFYQDLRKFDPGRENLLGATSWTFRRYGLALVSVAFCASAWFALDLLFNTTAPLLVFVPAVLLSSVLGGLGPGLLATVLSLVISIGFEPSLVTGQPITSAIFAVVSLGIAYWGDQASRNRQAAIRTTRSSWPQPKICARAKPI